MCRVSSSFDALFRVTEVKSTVVFAAAGDGLGLTLFMFIHLQLVTVFLPHYIINVWYYYAFGT